ncbi:MAG: UTP--glucose-1-phosphate uridylyltransferase [Clostridia bacterium]|nr:UTP--glucose-1-phosphate uridylyltransferase [Clostridia bacterium]
MRVRHAVILLGGKGTRFLPATKAVAKELFPVGNTPALMFHLKECLDSGIKEVTIVLSKQKKDVKKFFKHDKELEKWLEKCGKENLLDSWREIVDNIKFNFVYQSKKWNGTGGAVYVTKKYTKGEPFIVFFGDDVCISKDGDLPATKELIDLHEKTGKYILGALKVNDELVDRYGIVVPGKALDDKTVEVKGFVEKPQKGTQPSNLASLARYVVLPEIYERILKVQPYGNGELGLPEAIKSRCEDNLVLAREFSAKYWDLGNKLEFVKCNIAMALENPETSEGLKEYLKEFNK